MYNTADYQQGIDCSRRPILRYRIKKSKDVPKLLGILYYVVDKDNKKWWYNRYTNSFFMDTMDEFNRTREESINFWNCYCNESDFENAYNANPFPNLPVKVNLQFSIVFD